MGLLQKFETLASSFRELDLEEQVNFIKAMDKDIQKRFEDTRKKIDAMKVVSSPLVRICSLRISAGRVFNVLPLD